MKTKKAKAEAMPNSTKSIYIGVRVEPWLRHKLDSIAKATDITLTQLVRRAVKEYVERLEKAA